MKDRKVRMENLVSTKAHQKPSNRPPKSGGKWEKAWMSRELPFYPSITILSF